MKICAYVQTSYAKPVYKTECFNVRAWVGMSVIIWDTLPTRYLHTYANIPKMIEKMGP